MSQPTLLAVLTEQAKTREEAAWNAARMEQSDKYRELLADGARHASKEDWHSASRCCREAIALRPDEPTGYLGATLGSSGRIVEAAQLFLEFLEAKELEELFQADSKNWAVTTADAFEILRLQECDEASTLAADSCGELARPEWWNDEGLKALSASVLRAAPNDEAAIDMRAHVLSGEVGGWEAGTRSAAELKQAATHYDRSAALCPGSGVELSEAADWCRSKAEAGRQMEDIPATCCCFL